MKIRLKLASLVLLLFVLTNCIKENECCCSQDYTVLGLKFRYATNKSIHQQTEFPPNAMLAVFIFDDKGTFVSQINDSLNQVNDDYTMKLPFKQGSYQFVAWTGYDEMYLANLHTSFLCNLIYPTFSRILLYSC